MDSAVRSSVGQDSVADTQPEPSVKIRDILKATRTVSFEFFPPKTDEGIPSVFRAIDRLKGYRPDFASVTYGAGGSTQALTEEIVVRIKAETNLLPMAHLTCAAQTKEAVHNVLTRLEQAGIENIIALRGDPPVGQDNFVPVEGGFAHATDLIEHIKSNFKFGIAAACYPEAHVESTNSQTDMDFTKRKVDTGAEFLITQLFYNNDDFYAFQERARKAGIDVPIIPGIMPILSTSQIHRITSLCGASIPSELDAQLVKHADDDKAVREIGIEHATKQVRELWDNGVDGVHFYVLNRSYSVSKVLQNLGLPDHSGDSSQ